MVDFLRENTWCSPEQYKWGFSVAQIRLMSYDFTHIEYLNKEMVKQEQDTVKIESIDDLKNLSDFGIPIISKPKPKA